MNFMKKLVSSIVLLISVANLQAQSISHIRAEEWGSSGGAQISLKWLKKKESYFRNSLILKYTRRGSNPGHPD